MSSLPKENRWFLNLIGLDASNAAKTIFTVEIYNKEADIITIEQFSRERYQLNSVKAFLHDLSCMFIPHLSEGSEIARIRAQYEELGINNTTMRVLPASMCMTLEMLKYNPHMNEQSNFSKPVNKERLQDSIFRDPTPEEIDRALEQIRSISR